MEEFYERHALLIAFDFNDRVIAYDVDTVAAMDTIYEHAEKWALERKLDFEPAGPALAEMPRPGESLLVVYRDEGLWEQLWGPIAGGATFGGGVYEVLLDAQLVAELRSRTYAAVMTTPGRHTIQFRFSQATSGTRATFPPGGSEAESTASAPAASERIDLDLEDGGRSYLLLQEIEERTGFLSPATIKLQVQTVEGADARPRLNELRRTW